MQNLPHGRERSEGFFESLPASLITIGGAFFGGALGAVLGAFVALHLKSPSSNSDSGLGAGIALLIIGLAIVAGGAIVGAVFGGITTRRSLESSHGSIAARVIAVLGFGIAGVVVIGYKLLTGTGDQAIAAARLYNAKHDRGVAMEEARRNGAYAKDASAATPAPVTVMPKAPASTVAVPPAIASPSEPSDGRFVHPTPTSAELASAYGMLGYPNSQIYQSNYPRPDTGIPFDLVMLTSSDSLPQVVTYYRSHLLTTLVDDGTTYSGATTRVSDGRMTKVHASQARGLTYIVLDTR